MKVTLQDIANATGYSISTVSRVLSGSNKISGSARTDIIAAAQRLKYPLNRIRASDKIQTELNVALITDFHEGEFYASYFYGFAQSAKSLNLRLSLLSLNNPREEIKEYIGQVSDQYYDGAILFMPELTREDYETLMGDLPDQFPVISNALIESPVIPTITFDGYGGGHIAAEHFLRQGYKTLGIVKGPVHKAETRFRYMGYIDYCQANHSQVALTWEYLGDFSFQSGMDAFADWRKHPNRPRAVFLSNDLMATGFMEAARVENIRIPEDLAILGYDDLPMCVHSHPEISSIRTDFTALGLTTLRTLKSMILRPEQPVGVQSLIPASLNIRASS
jgi:DNA-binding LacI/PurR family transcriptional regulator